jgi:hypothetical protein
MGGDVSSAASGEGGVSFDLLLAQGFAPLPTRFAPAAPFAEGAFPTPSGKCEFFSQRLADKGVDGLPDHLPNFEAAASNPALAVRYPLAMISPPAAQLPELHVRQREKSSRNRRRTACWNCVPPMQQHGALPTVTWCAFSTTGAATTAPHASVTVLGLAWPMAWACGGASWACAAPM